MKRILLLAALLGVFSGCVKDKISLDKEQQGYWYLSSFQMLIETPSGNRYEVPTGYTASNTTRYMKVKGGSFTPYVNFSKVEWNSMPMTPGCLYTFEPEGVPASDAVKADVAGDVITVTGQSTIDYRRDGNGDPIDVDSDGQISTWDLMFVSGAGHPFASYGFNNSFLSAVGSTPQLPLSVTCTLVYRITGSAHFEEWYRGE